MFRHKSHQQLQYIHEIVILWYREERTWGYCGVNIEQWGNILHLAKVSKGYLKLWGVHSRPYMSVKDRSKYMCIIHCYLFLWCLIVAAVMGEGKVEKKTVEILDYITNIWTKELQYVLYKMKGCYMSVVFPGNVVITLYSYKVHCVPDWSDWFICYASLHCKQNHFCQDL